MISQKSQPSEAVLMVKSMRGTFEFDQPLKQTEQNASNRKDLKQ